MAALEAAIVGTPFVGSDTSGLREACSVAGLRTFAADEDGDLEAKLSEMWIHPDRYLAKNGDFSALSLERVVDEYVRLCSVALE
jgi:hypothetical protein